MSYESKLLLHYIMPTREAVEQTLLRTLIKHGGVIKEFISGEPIVDEIANEFRLTNRQRSAFLTTTYRKENRIKRAYLWHRLLFRAADTLAKNGLVSRPTETYSLTGKREWMLTEEGFDKALKLCNIPNQRKEDLPVKSYEVQKIINKLIEVPIAKDYNPLDKDKKLIASTRQSLLRARGFRLAVIDVYDYSCAVCGLKISAPDSLIWEVEAAHIVPSSSYGKDDVCNGIAFCRLHHWAFDVGWFTLSDEYVVNVSSKIRDLPANFGKMGNYEFLKVFSKLKTRIFLPKKVKIYPHPNAIHWHQKNIFHR